MTTESSAGPLAVSQQKPLVPMAIPLPPPEQRRSREARPPSAGEKPSRYTLPRALRSGSPVGYRTRLPLTAAEVESAMPLLALEPPQGFEPGPATSEQELFEESALGVLSSRQSTNFRGFRQVTFGTADSRAVTELLSRLQGRDAPVLDHAAHTHVVLCRPYRTPFTMLLTLVGHRQLTSPVSVLQRALRKRLRHESDLPSIALLPELHLGILADGMERAARIASAGARAASVLQAPFCAPHREANAPVLRQLEALCGVGRRERAAGWRIGLVAQVGRVRGGQRITLPSAAWRRLGASLLSFRSERIQPGVNADPTAPAPYQQRQSMDVPDGLTEMAGRAAFNAFCRWTGVEREAAKALLLLERVDVLTPGGKERLRGLRQHLGEVTDRVVRDLPWWAELATGKAFSRNANRGRKAFGLAGQRIYMGGLAPAEVAQAGVPWELAVRALGAAAARSALYTELCGVLALPPGCDLLAGVCLMAGPVNQNDISRTYYGGEDLLARAFPGRDPRSLLVWTLKAKTVADPIGNEEQLMSAERQGALVDLRPAPHEVCSVISGGTARPMRQREGRTNGERAFADAENFVRAPDGAAIDGNEGEPWPAAWAGERLD